MIVRFLYYVLRTTLLCLAAAVGYVAVYIPLMNLLFDKRIGFIIVSIIGISVYVAYRLAKLADNYLPRLSRNSKVA